MLERMVDFFEARLDGYDEHMLNDIEHAREFYPYTAELLPQKKGANILDLGCGTGLELEEYFKLNPDVQITGIDLSRAMLNALREKFTYGNLNLITGSYFEVPFGNRCFDAAVSVESLHYFTKEEKIPLYAKLCDSLKPKGYFILTDYLALSDDEEEVHFAEFNRLKGEQGIADNDLYHYDTPLTVEHEAEALLSGGFMSVELVARWGATHILKAMK